jgi:hypothetical protein
MTARAFSLALLLAAAPLLHADTAPPKAVTVPFELLKTGHMAVKVKVNGKGPYRLIFDTGAPITLVNTKVAREAGVLRAASASPFGGIFGGATEAVIKELEVGEQKAGNVAAVVMDHPTVEAISRALGPIEGIVGFPFFARFRMTLDYQAKTLTFVPSGYKPPDTMRGLMFALMAGPGDEPQVLSPAALWGVVVRKDDGDEEAGVTVKQVLAGSPAAAGGIKPGDRLLTLDGRWTDTVADLFAAAGHVKPGTTADVVVRRDGKERVLKVKPSDGL